MALRSMTGYGRASREDELGTFVVEARSVNNRYFDFHSRLAHEWGEIEARVRDLVHRRIARGKVDLWVRWTPPAGLAAEVDLSADMLAQIIQRFQDTSRRLGAPIEIPWAELFKLPGVLTVRPPELNADALYQALEPAITAALDQMDAMRSAEGRAMAEAIAGHLATLRRETDVIERLGGSVLETQRKRLRRLVEQMRPEIGQALSENRLEAEVLLFADRMDITEETVRLRSHFEAFDQLLDSEESEPVGKRLEFLGQEILREANTIGSKARDAEIAAAVVTLKHEVEKIREQLQNIE